MALARGARIEDGFNRRIIPYLRSRGFVPELVPYTGYGSTEFVRVLARAVMVDPNNTPKDPTAEERLEESQRGWRQFVSTHVAMLPITITAGNTTIQTSTTRNGYVDVIVRDHGLEPGWQNVSITAISGDSVDVPVYIVAPGTKFGLISDIDDTVIVTYLPRAFIAAWNSFVKHTSTRQPVPGMADLYNELLRRHPGMPVMYISTGAWNVVTTMTRFLKRHGYPVGPMLMTDWGPTNTGWFRSGQEHKRTQLRRLAIEFPEIEWFLVGDDGQHDPMIYREMAREHPEHVRAVLIRELNPVEQFLSHGTTTELEYNLFGTRDDLDLPVPTLHGPDGFALLDDLPAPDIT